MDYFLHARRKDTQQGDRILITPFDKAVVPAIVQAINEARLNAYAPVSLHVPPISEEERAESDRHVKKLGWARTPRSPSGRSGRRHVRRSKSRVGDHTEGSRRRPMRREPQIYILHGSLRVLCRPEPVLFRTLMG
jgi:hypothetical protein